jgi:hypothetical protein
VTEDAPALSDTVNHHLKLLKAVYNRAIRAGRLTYNPVAAVKLYQEHYTVQRAGGWKTQVMVQRYAHLSPDHIKAAVERLAASNSGRATSTKTGTMAAGENEERAASA